MKQPVQLFKALADETRLRIISLLLNHGELCVCEIMAALAAPQSTISRHLSWLRTSGLIDGRRRGVWIYYRIVEDEGLSSAILKALSPHCCNLEPARQDRQRLAAFATVKAGTSCCARTATAEPR